MSSPGVAGIPWNESPHFYDPAVVLAGTDVEYAEHGHRSEFAKHAEELLHRVTFVVIDVETTGWEPGPDALTEVAAVRFTGGEPCGRYHSLVDPGVHIPY